MDKKDKSEHEFTLHRRIVTYGDMKIHLKKAGNLKQFKNKLLAPYSLFYEDVSSDCKDVFIVAEIYKSGDFIKRKIDRITQNSYREYVYHKNGEVVILYHSGRPKIFYGHENNSENEDDLYGRISSCKSYDKIYVSHDCQGNKTGFLKAFWKRFFQSQ